MEGRGTIWAQTLVVSAVYAAAIVVLHRYVFHGWHPALAIALSFSVVQVFAIVTMLAVLLTRRGVARRRAVRSVRIAEAAANAIAEHAAGRDRLRALRELAVESRRDVSRALASFLATTRGTMHDRVAALAKDLGIARRDVLEREETTTLFDRALLADETRGRAAELAQTEIKHALATGDETAMITALDLLRAWRVSLDVGHFENAVSHPSQEVRERAFLALPYVRAQRFPLEGLTDSSPKVRAAAAQAAGKLRSTELVPDLERLLGDDDHEAAVAAAFALAMTDPGLGALHRRVSEGNRVAFEALEKATLGRLEVA